VAKTFFSTTMNCKHKIIHKLRRDLRRQNDFYKHIGVSLAKNIKLSLMSFWVEVSLIMLIATIFGLVLLVVPIIGFYWGPRGKPPATKEERKQNREEELKMRAEQIERSKNTKIVTRKPSFWDNSKNY
jgi:hypothetical protein